MSQNTSITEFLEQTLKSVEELKKKILELENDIKKNEIVKPKIDKDEIVLESLRKGYITLDMIDEKYSKDKNFVDIALKANPENICYVNDSLLDDFVEYRNDHIKDVLKENGLKLGDFPSSIKKDKEMCVIAINQNYQAFKYCQTDEINNDKTLVLELVDKDGMLLEFASEELKKDFEVVITAISNNNEAKQFISSEIKEKILSLFS